MDWQKQSLRVGAGVILFAICFRLLPGLLPGAAAFLSQPEVAAFLIYLETGRVLRPLPEETGPPETQMPEITVPAETAVQAMVPLPAFSPQDTALVELKYHADLEPDLEELLCRDLRWDLAGAGPTVLILHSHATESYTKSKGEKFETM